MLKRATTVWVTLIAVFLYLPSSAFSQNLESFEENVTEFTLDNGLHFIIVERDVAPVAHFFTYVDVGAANEPVGNTGIAHIFEHMVFKGSHTIGTTNHGEEVKYINQMDDAYTAWLNEYNKFESDEEKLESLWAEFEQLQEQAGEFVVNNEFTQIIEKEGASGVNAFASTDGTGYFYSLPQNKAELWFMLEADRFMNPVMREFYVEKDGTTSCPIKMNPPNTSSMSTANFRIVNMARDRIDSFDPSTLMRVRLPMMRASAITRPVPAEAGS